ncbi:MAG: hypothetical protein D8M57_03450 [Candidatus Scalindua sp. AMX11]|nr:MAG: hypothetical protein DWQ00_11240 [Candidatus Scalindua sp.]NOG82780.1 hypothetical protein [Planctomycetota bacterium]RZV95346.1 MAG: hypothetical protein EX341_03175 [Candidatus Scalindua sp. SCAELEC01]TDE66171.1 MAG: hypothetical protein D8M57_03450 [Candidatus Scalindua sp. AMX11]GJQ57788.1 MAG: hypothetical protein SCALA701_05890 [Candidatus Scalindua sp.]
MVTKLQDIKFENNSSGEEIAHTIEFDQETLKFDNGLYSEKGGQDKSKVIEHKFDVFGIVKLLLKES